MSDGSAFKDFIRRIRAGDEQAATDLVRQYEPLIRREIRLHMEDQRLNRVLDSGDICQSVLASFFVRAALGQYELEEPHQLLKLLATMARHKLADQISRERAGRRDNRRVAEGSAETHEVSAGTASPSRQVAARELLEQVQRRLTPEERQLAELRSQGLEWAEIAAQIGGRPDALRKRLARAMDRVAQELDLLEQSQA